MWRGVKDNDEQDDKSVMDRLFFRLIQIYVEFFAIDFLGSEISSKKFKATNISMFGFLVGCNIFSVVILICW